MAAKMPQLEILTDDDKSFKIDYESIKASRFITWLLEDLNINGEKDETIALPDIKSVSLGPILEWLNHHRENPSDILHPRHKLPDWYRNHLDNQLTGGYYREFIIDIQHLDMKMLMELACQHMGSKIKGKSVEEMRKLLNINPSNAKKGRPACSANSS